MIEHVLNRFRQKPINEQRRMMILVASIFMILFWFGFYQPLNQAINALQLRCEKLRHDAEWFGVQVSAAGLLPEKKPPSKPSELIRSSLKKLGLVATVQEASTGELSVSATNMKIHSFVRWLEEIQLGYGLSIVEIEFHASLEAADTITLTRMMLGLNSNG